MLSHLVTIGNSKGLRLSKSILEQCEIQDDIELEVENKEIRIKAVKSKPRQGWEDAFKKNYTKSQAMLIPDSIDLEMEDWEW